MKKGPGFRICFAVVSLAAVIMGGCTTVQSIALTPPARILFGQGEEFTYDGLQVTGTTKKGETKDLSGNSKLKVRYLLGGTLDLTGLTATATWEGAGDAPVTPIYLSGFDSNAAGSQTVIVEALGKQASFTVTVKEPADPAAWTPAQGGFARHITGIAYGNGVFAAAAYNDDKPNEGIIAYSADGINWTKSSFLGNFKVLPTARISRAGTFGLRSITVAE